MHLHYKRDSCTHFFSSEFCRTFKNTFPLGHSWARASDFIFDLVKSNKYMKVSFLFTLFYRNISSFIFLFLSLIFGVFEIDFEPIFLQNIFVFTFCCDEYLLVRQVFRRSLLDGIRNLLYDVWWVVWWTMDVKKPIVWFFIRTVSSISQIKWNV